jgi:hypothetical protein
MDRQGNLTVDDGPELDLDQLLHPARAFREPRDVVCHPYLTRREKQAVLARWARDAAAIGAVQALRQDPKERGVAVDDVLAALGELERTIELPPIHGRPHSGIRSRKPVEVNH